MTQVTLKARTLARLAIITCTAGLMVGCGWTARDEFYRNRSVVLAPQAGDGSQITSTTQRLGAPTVAAPQVAEHRRGNVDQTTAQ